MWPHNVPLNATSAIPELEAVDLWAAGAGTRAEDGVGVGIGAEDGVDFLAELEGGLLLVVWEVVLLRLTRAEPDIIPNLILTSSF